MAESSRSNSSTPSEEGSVTDMGRRGSKGSLRPRILPVNELVESKERGEWTIFSATQNLPAALNDPAHRETDLFTRTWGDSFVAHAPIPPCSSLPSIELADFLRYLKETSAGRKFHRSVMRELGKSESAPPSPASPLPLQELQLDGRTYDLSSVPKIFFQQDFSLEDRRTFLQVIPLPHLLPSSLTEKGLLGGDSINGSITTLNSSKLLHEKLTHHLDIVEVHLAHQISQKSDMFFSTLASQHELEVAIMNVRHDAVELRQHLKSLDGTLTQRTLQLFLLQRRRTRRKAISRLLQQVALVHQTQNLIQMLLGTSDFVGALELITRTQSALVQELQGIKCLRHLGCQLVEMEKMIEKMMEVDFVHIAVDDMRARLRMYRKLNEEQARSSTSSLEEMDTEVQLDSVVKGLLRRRKLHFLSALGTELLSISKAKVRQVVMDYLQMSEEEEEVEEPSNTLSGRMKVMSLESWLCMLNHVFTFMLSYLRCVKGTLMVVMEVCQEAAGISAHTYSPAQPQPAHSVFSTPLETLPPPLQDMPVGDIPLVNGISTLEEQDVEERLEQLLLQDDLTDAKIEEMASTTMKNHTNGTTPVSAENHVDEREEVKEEDGDQAKEERQQDSSQLPDKWQSQYLSKSNCKQLVGECQSVLYAVSDLIHLRCTKIINIRARAGLLEDLVSSDFVQLVRLIAQFVNSSAAITGRLCPHLRSAVLVQAKKYLESFHMSRKSKLSLLLDGERWRQAEVPPEIQHFTDTLETGIPLYSDLEVYEPSPLVQGHTQHPSQFLSVHGEKFAVVGVMLLLIKMVMEYCQCTDDLPMLVTEVLGKLVDVMKFFNSRTCQLVLGAGAVEAVGLKTITARHLALVLRCLQAAMVLVSDIKKHFRRRLTPRKCVLLLQLDQVQEDMGSHCREINHKILTIIDDLMARHLSRWEAKAPTPSQCFRAITKQLLKLHEALEDIVPHHYLQALFEGIEKSFLSRLKVQLVRLGVTNNGSTEHGNVNSDLSHMKASMESLDNVSVFGNSLFDIWTTSR